jgi:hypothetical protein
MCHAIEDTARRFLGAMLVARNVGYLNQVHSTLNYSRKAAAIGRLLAGVAHEVKNPLNAMTIHLELLKQKVGSIKEPIVVPGPPGSPARQLDLAKHVGIIAAEIKRLDEVVAGFLKFARPDELKLQPVRLANVIHDVAMTITPEAQRRNVTLREECAHDLPAINADQGMLMQAVLNLAINALQAMPEGGSLRLSCRRSSRRRVALSVQDTGIGIPPENLPRIFGDHERGCAGVRPADGSHALTRFSSHARFRCLSDHASAREWQSRAPVNTVRSGPYMFSRLGPLHHARRRARRASGARGAARAAAHRRSGAGARPGQYRTGRRPAAGEADSACQREAAAAEPARREQSRRDAENRRQTAGPGATHRRAGAERPAAGCRPDRYPDPRHRRRRRVGAGDS